MLVGYGDDSVAQLGGAHIACENISNVAAKLLEDARIGIAPLGKVDALCALRSEGTAMAMISSTASPRIMASRHRDRYLATMNLLFETYSKQMEPMLDHVAGSLPIDQLEVRDLVSGKGFEMIETRRKMTG